MIKADLLQKTDVFKNITLELSEGILCILSKKPEKSSALLDALAGVRLFDGGTLSGTENAAYLSKGAPLPGTLTAEEYLNFVCSVKKTEEPSEKVMELTAELSEKRIESLSLIERLTLGVAASLIGDPSVIILEEPYSGLSFDEYADFKLVVKSAAETVPVIFSCTSVYECKAISDKTLVLSGGSMIYFGETEALFNTAITETDIVCLIKGEKEEIAKALESYEPVIEETVREEIFLVSVKKVQVFRAAEVRSRLKKLLSRARLSLLEMRSENEALLNIINELTENDNKKRRKYEESLPRKITKITKSFVSFSHDDDDEADEEESEGQSEEYAEDVTEEADELTDGDEDCSDDE